MCFSFTRGWLVQAGNLRSILQHGRQKQGGPGGPGVAFFQALVPWAQRAAASASGKSTVLAFVFLPHIFLSHRISLKKMEMPQIW